MQKSAAVIYFLLFALCAHAQAPVVKTGKLVLGEIAGKGGVAAEKATIDALRTTRAINGLQSAVNGLTMNSSLLTPAQTLAIENMTLKLNSIQKGDLVVSPEANLDTTDKSKEKPTPNHSIAPSATLSYAKSEAVEAFSTPFYVEDNNRLISRNERDFYAGVNETLRPLGQVEPATPSELPNYLAHSVPLETFSYLQKSYQKLQESVAEAKSYVVPKLIYMSLPVEKRPQPQEIREINSFITGVQTQISVLSNSLPDDPYLIAQKEYWQQMFYAFNPNLRGLSVKKSGISSVQQGREFDAKEFMLYNADGKDYLLPENESLIVDPDEEMTDMEMRMRFRKEQALLKEVEPEIAQRAVQMPKNLKIALINDDYLPRLNFAAWGKKGLLGEGSSVEVFDNGLDFMKQINNGIKYDIIITDLLVPHAGIEMMPQLRLTDPNSIVFACSKYDREEVGLMDLFNVGMDGYIYYGSILNNGQLGVLEVQRAIQNYYHYSQLHGWRR